MGGHAYLGKRERHLRSRAENSRGFLATLVDTAGHNEKHAGRVDRRKRSKKSDGRITFGQLCASVAYHYHLTPEQVAAMSGPQLLMWHERITVETAYAKLLDLEVSLVPHTEHPDRSLRNIRDNLIKMTEGKNGNDR